jgi:hypothetical protein
MSLLRSPQLHMTVNIGTWLGHLHRNNSSLFTSSVLSDYNTLQGTIYCYSIGAIGLGQQYLSPCRHNTASASFSLLSHHIGARVVVVDFVT